MKTAAPPASQAAQAHPASAQLQKTTIVSAYGRLPLSFEPAETDTGTEYVARGQGYTLGLSANRISLGLRRGRSAGRRGRREAAPAQAMEPPVALTLRLAGANLRATAVAEDRLPGTSNYLIGNDRSKWRTDVVHYGRVRYRGVYPGIDVVYYGNQRRLEHDFKVSPKADPRKIRIAVEGAKSLALDASGDLVVKVAGGEVRLHKPVIYQKTEQGRREIAGGYVLGKRNEVGIRVGEYDRRRGLVIDPVLGYATYLGGSGEDFIGSLVVDLSGNAYLVGTTASTNFPTTAGVLSTTCQNCFGATDDVFVASINPSGTALNYSTFLGGSNDDEGYAIAIDGSGNAYVTGFTNSSNFPTTAGAFQTSLKSFMGNAFVSVLNPTGTGLLYSTFLGGTARDYGNPLALDGSGNIYVGGISYSSDFPTVGTPISTPPPIWYASTDGGISYTASSTGITSLQVFDTVVDKGTPGTLYVGTVGGGVYKSTNSGAAWTQMPTPFNVSLNPAQLGGDYVNALVMDANTTGAAATLYAGSQFFGITRTSNGGASWGMINSGFNGGSVLSLALNPSNTATLYAGTGGRGVWVTNNANAATPTWTQMPLTGLTNTTVEALAVNPVGGTVYAGTDGGVFAFSTVNNNWVALTNGIPPGLTIHQLAVDGSGTLYAAATTVFKFNSSSSSWTAISGSGSNTINGTAEVFGITIDPNVPSTLYAATQLGVFKSTDGGVNWALHAPGPGLVTTNGSRVAVDPNNSGNVYFSGFNPMSFVATFPAGGGTPLLLTQFGGLSGQTYITSIAADSLGNAYVAGTANTPLPGPLVGGQSTIVSPPGYDAFVSKITPSQTVSYSRLLGGSGFDEVVGLAVDSSFNAYAAGLTYSNDFPTTGNAFQPAHNPSPAGDAFVVELDPTGANLLYSSFFGGSGDDQGFNLALLSPGIVGIVGTTSSTDLPTVNAVQPFNAGSYDAFFAKFDLTQSGAASLLYSTYLGGSSYEAATGVGFDRPGNVYIGGYSYSSNLPTTAGVVQGALSVAPDAMMFKLQSTGNSSDVGVTIGSSLGTNPYEGQSYTYTVNVSDAGPNSAGAPSVMVTGSIPTNVTVTAVTPSQGSCSGLQSFSCSLGTVALGNPSASITVSVTANAVSTPPVGATLNASVRVSTADDDPAPTNNSASIGVTVQREADLAITSLTAPDPVLNGTPFNYSLTVFNNGPNTATGVVVSYTLPAGVTFNSSNPAGLCSAAAGVVTCSVGSLGSSVGTAFLVNVTPHNAGTLMSTFVVSSSLVVDDGANGGPGTNNTGIFSNTINANVDLRLQASGAVEAPVGGSAPILLTIRNLSTTDTASFPFLQLNLDGMSYVNFSSPNSGVSCDGPSCSLPDLPPLTTLRVTIFATSLFQGLYTASGTLTFSGTDTNLTNNNSTTQVTFAGAVGTNLTTLLSDFETSSIQAYSGYPTPQPVCCGGPILGGASPSNVVIAPNGRLAFTANVNGSYISVIDLTIGAEVARIRNVRSWSLAMTSDGKKLASVGFDKDELDIIDVADFDNPTSGVTRISLDGALGDVTGADDIHPFSLALTGYRAYIANQFGAVLSVDFGGTPIIAPVANTAGLRQRHAGHQVAVTPDGSTAVVYGLPTAGGNAVVYLIPTGSNVASTVATSFTNPRTVAITPNLNAATGTLGFLSDGGDLHLLDLRTGSGTYSQILSGTLSVGGGPIQDMALSPDGATLQAVRGLVQGALDPPSRLYSLNTSALLSNPAGAILSAVDIAGSISVRGLAIGYVQTSPLSGAPEVFDVQPAVMTNEAPKTVTIFGDNFGSGAMVRIGNLEPLAATFVSRQQLTVTVPAGAAVQDGKIVVTLANTGAGPLQAHVSGGGQQTDASLRIEPPATFAPIHPVAAGSYSTAKTALLLRDSTLVAGSPAATSLALSPDGRYAYSDTFQVSIADLDSSQLLSASIFPNRNGAQGDGMAVAPDPVSGKKVAYLVSCDTTNCASDTLYVFDVDPGSNPRNTLLRNLQASPTDFQFAQGLAATPDGQYVYSVDTYGSTFDGTPTASRLVIFNVPAGTATVIADITTLGADVTQAHIAVSPDGKSLLLSGPNAKSILVLDISGTVVGSSSPTNPQPVPGGPIVGSGAASNPPQFFAFQVVGSRLFAYDSGQRYVQAFNFDPVNASFSPLGAYTVASAPGTFSGDWGMAVTPEGTLVYVPVENEDAVAVLDAGLVASSSPNALITKMRTAVNPSMLAVSPRTNSSADLTAGISTSLVALTGVGDQAIINQPFDIFISMKNNGPAQATGTSMTLSIPTGMQVNRAYIADGSGFSIFTCTIATNQVTCPVGNLGVNSQVYVDVNVTPLAVGSYSFSNTVSGNELDANPADNTALDGVNVNSSGADVALTISASPNPATLGSPVAVTAVVTNNGPAVATGVTATIFFNPPMTPVLTPTQGSCTTFGTCTLGDIAPNTSVTITGSVTYPTSGIAARTSISGYAASSSTVDPNFSNNYSAYDLKLTNPTPGITRLLIPNAGNGQLQAYDATTFQPAGPPSQTGASPGAMAISPNHRLAFVANFNADYVSVNDLSIQQEIYRIRGVRAANIGITSDGTRLVAPQYVGDSVAIIDASTFQILQVVPLNGVVGDSSSNPSDIQFGGMVMVGSKAYIDLYAGTGPNPVVVIDAASAPSAAATFVTGVLEQSQGFPGGSSLAAVPGGQYVVAVRYGSTCSGVGDCPVQIISTASNSVVGPVTGAMNFGQSVIAAAGSLGYLVSDYDGGVYSIDLNSASGTFGQVLPRSPAILPLFPKYLTTSSSGPSRLYASTNDSVAPNFAVIDTGLLASSPGSAVIYSTAIGVTRLRAAVSSVVDILPEANAPQISEVQPAFVFNNVANTITISGAGFASNALVKIGSLDPAPATFVSSNQLQVTLPAGTPAQSAAVLVMNPNTGGAQSQQWLSGVMNFSNSGFTEKALEITAPVTFQSKYEAFISNAGDGSIRSIGGHSIFISPWPSGIAFTPDGTELYTTSLYLGQPFAAATNGGNVTPIVIPAPGTSGTATGLSEGIAVAPNPAGGQPVAYAASASFDTSTRMWGEQLNVIDANPASPSFNTVIDVLGAPDLADFLSQSRGALAVAPTGTTNYVYENTNIGSGSAPAGAIMVFDTAARDTATNLTADLGVADYQPKIVTTSDAHWLLLQDTTGNVKVFDISSTPLIPAPIATSVARVTPAGKTTPQFGSFTVAGSHLYAYDGAQSLLEVFNFNPAGGDLSFVASFIAPGHGTSQYAGIAVTPDESLIAVVEPNDDAVAVLDGAKVRANDPTALISQFGTGVGPQVVAVSPKLRDTAPNDVGITITHSPNPAQLGGSLTYNVTLTEYGPFTGSGGSGDHGGFIINFDPSLVPVSSSFVYQLGLDCRLSGTQFGCDIGHGGPDLGAPPVSITGNIVFQPTAVQTVTVTGYIDGGGYDPNTSNNVATDSTAVVAADLGVSMTASPTSLAPGANLAYTITVVNHGPSASTGYTLTDTLPANTSFVSASTGCTPATTTVTCTSSGLGAGLSATFIIVVTPTAEATLINTVTVTGNEADPVSTNNTASSQNLSVEADVAVSAAITPVLSSGSSGVSTTIMNNGPADATGLVFTDVLDNYGYVSATVAGGTCTYSAPVVTCTIASLPNGASVALTVMVSPPKQGWASHSLHVAASQPDPNPVNNSLRLGPALDSFNTPLGTNVSVLTADAADGLTASVTFSNVMRIGSTTMSPLAASSLPPGFRSGRQPTIFDLSTNAVFSGTVGLTVRFAPANFRHPALVRLFHMEGGVWVDRTTGLDAAAGAISASVLSLSPFALLEPLDSIPVANAGTDRSVPGVTAGGAPVTLDGSSSSDADGDALTYRWSGPFPEGGGVVSGVRPLVTLPLGVSRVTLVVNDGEADSPAVTLNVAVTDFQLSAPAASVALNRGQSASFTITSTPLYGAFSGPVALSCDSGSPAVTCSLSAASITPGAAGATATLTVTAAAGSARIPGSTRYLALWLGGLPLFGIVLLGPGRRGKRARLAILLMLLLILLALQVACGGGGAGQTQSSSAGATSSAVRVTITGTSGTLTRTSAVTVMVAQ